MIKRINLVILAICFPVLTFAQIGKTKEDISKLYGSPWRIESFGAEVDNEKISPFGQVFIFKKDGMFIAAIYFSSDSCREVHYTRDPKVSLPWDDSVIRSILKLNGGGWVPAIDGSWSLASGVTAKHWLDGGLDNLKITAPEYSDDFWHGFMSKQKDFDYR